MSRSVFRGGRIVGGKIFAVFVEGILSSLHQVRSPQWRTVRAGPGTGTVPERSAISGRECHTGPEVRFVFVSRVQSGAHEAQERHVELDRDIRSRSVSFPHKDPQEDAEVILTTGDLRILCRRSVFSFFLP